METWQSNVGIVTLYTILLALMACGSGGGSSGGSTSGVPSAKINYQTPAPGSQNVYAVQGVDTGNNAFSYTYATTYNAVNADGTSSASTSFVSGVPVNGVNYFSPVTQSYDSTGHVQTEVTVQLGTATFSPIGEGLPFPLYVGESWNASWTQLDNGNSVYQSFAIPNGQVVGTESVTVPAGTFNALKVDYTLMVTITAIGQTINVAKTVWVDVLTGSNIKTLTNYSYPPGYASSISVVQLTEQLQSYGQAPTPIAGKPWTWVSGTNKTNQVFNYGSQGVPATTNIPPERTGAVSWIDSSHTLWLFAGFSDMSSACPAYPTRSTGATCLLNDLWQFDLTAKTWTWVSGSNTVNTPGSYGTQGVPAASNVPGGRWGSVSWADSSGNFWLLGGEGNDSAGHLGSLNDLWQFNSTTKTWTWMSGSSTVDAPGSYGIQGVPATINVPGGRSGSVSWIDSHGNLWLFGGSGCDSACGGVTLNDLWEFSPTAGTWTWVSGANVGNQLGSYGTQGVAAATNVPGARSGSVSWFDANGNLWLFGGEGYDSVYIGELNDLWQFNPQTKMWTWINGANVRSQLGSYGTQGIPAATNVPGARSDSVSWIDTNGNLWLFGGAGFDSGLGGGCLNDLWQFNPSTGRWTWVSGANVGNQLGSYGTQGVAAAGNAPSGRGASVGWSDSSDNFWLFGGGNFYSLHNDLWLYRP